MTPRGRDSALDVGVVLFQGLKSTWLLFTYVNWMSQMQRHLQWPHCLRRHGELIRHSDSVFNRQSHPWILESSEVWRTRMRQRASGPAESATTLKHLLMDQIQQEQTPTETCTVETKHLVREWYRSVLLNWWVVIQKCAKASRNPWKLNFSVQFKGLDHCEWKGWQENSSVLVPSRLRTF